MGCRHPYVIVAVLLAGLSLSQAAHAAPPTRASGWIQNDFEAAQVEARRTGKPIFATFRCEA